MKTMKRSATTAQALFRWLNVSGRFAAPSGVVGPGEEFIATERQVPAAFRDTIQCLGPLEGGVPLSDSAPRPPVFQRGGIVRPPVGPLHPEVVEEVVVDEEAVVGDDDAEVIDDADEVAEPAEAEVEAPASAGTYRLAQRSAGWYDVIDEATGEPVNAAALRLGQANALMEELTDGDAS